MRKGIAFCTILGLLAPMQIYAHEQFLADVDFETWERHCHVYELKEARECWAILQKQLNKNGESKRGFVIIVHENESPLSFEVRDINQFGYSVDIQVDDNQIFKLACHASLCTPWEREDANEIIAQMKMGEKLSLQGYTRLGDKTYSRETISLEGFKAALGQ